MLDLLRSSAVGPSASSILLPQVNEDEGVDEREENEEKGERWAAVESLR